MLNQLMNLQSLPSQQFTRSTADALTHMINSYVSFLYYHPVDDLYAFFNETSFRFLDNPTPLIIDIPTANGLQILL